MIRIASEYPVSRLTNRSPPTGYYPLGLVKPFYCFIPTQFLSRRIGIVAGHMIGRIQKFPFSFASAMLYYYQFRLLVFLIYIAHMWIQWRNKKQIAEYIRNQPASDQIADQSGGPLLRAFLLRLARRASGACRAAEGNFTET